MDLRQLRMVFGVLTAAACGGLEPSSELFDTPGVAGAGPGAHAGASASGGAGAGGGGAGAGLGAGDGAGGGGGPDGNAADASRTDDIYGEQVARADAWWVAGTRIHHGDRPIRLRGINWFGLDTDALAMHGPPMSGRSVADFLTQVQSLGFNALRVPLAPEAIQPGHASAGWTHRGAIDTGREHFEELAAAAYSAGLYMLWDVHTCAAAVGHLKESPHDPACVGYGDAAWIEDVRTLARMAADYAPFVVGIDLFNEPHGLTYTEWRALVNDAGRAALEENPRILVFVEGVGGEGYAGDHWPFWGEDLTGIAIWPPELPASRVVYSPHVYGPSISNQDYFGVTDFPANMPAIWDEHFGYLFGDHAVVPGEFGGLYTGQDRVWQDAFVSYLVDKDAPGFFYWSLNPNSGDTGGILLDDWRGVNTDKLALLQPLLQLP